MKQCPHCGKTHSELTVYCARCKEIIGQALSKKLQEILDMRAKNEAEQFCGIDGYADENWPDHLMWHL